MTSIVLSLTLVPLPVDLIDTGAGETLSEEDRQQLGEPALRHLLRTTHPACYRCSGRA